MQTITFQKSKILEIFRSIQGEGIYAGARQLFVRFFECNMHCDWCDTPHSIGDTTRKYKEYALADLKNEIVSLWKGCHSVSLTGGEPLMQADVIHELIAILGHAGPKFYLETNGTLPSELTKVIEDVDIIAMDIKMPSSTKCRAFWAEHEEFLKIAVQKETFIKTVISADTDVEDWEKTVELVARVDSSIPVIVQPNTFDLKNNVITKCVEFQEYGSKYLSDVRVLPQMHKFLKLR